MAIFKQHVECGPRITTATYQLYGSCDQKYDFFHWTVQKYQLDGDDDCHACLGNRLFQHLISYLIHWFQTPLSIGWNLQTNARLIQKHTNLPISELGILCRLFSFVHSWKPRTINKTRAVRLRTHWTSRNRDWVKGKSRQDRRLEYI